MRRINPERILRLIARDVRVVEQEAIGVFEIFPDWVEFVENKSPRLGVLAVVGPGKGFGRRFEKVLLLEMGVSRGRPYHPAKGLKRQLGQPEINKRRKWFSLSPEQYQLVAPFLFAKLQELTNQRESTWKTSAFSGDPFILPTPRYYWSRHQKTLFETVSYQPQPKGVRFSASREDEVLLRDIYWAEKHLNSYLRGKLIGLAKFIDLLLSYYQGNNWQGERFLKLQKVQWIQNVLRERKLPAYLIKEMMDLKDKRGLPLIKDSRFGEIAKKFGVEVYQEKTEEQRLAEKALPNPSQRLSEIQLRVTTGLEADKDYVVFEIFPSHKSKEEQKEEGLPF